MRSSVITKAYTDIPLCEKEILRYAGAPVADEKTVHLLRQCIEEVEKSISYKVCYKLFDLNSDPDGCTLDGYRVKSPELASRLFGYKRVLVFAATVGIGIDRLISKYSRLSPAKALLIQGIGAERVEALCDSFLSDFERNEGILLKPRFSPGYGKISLGVQRDIFTLLDCEKKIGLYLNSSMLMSPTKSVTAFAPASD